MSAALTPPDSFREAANEMHMELECAELDVLGAFLHLLLDANQRFNLTTITDHEEAWHRHILDSLSLLPFLQQADAKRVIDVGSGGGLPGIPLAICCPDASFVLVEATRKKAQFLIDTANELSLANVNVVSDRAETIGLDREGHRERYDIVTARAVGKLQVLLELTIPLARVGGHVLAIKGEQASQEVEDASGAMHLLHAVVVDLHLTTTGTIVVVEKLRATPRMYPRRPGEPKRAPLGGAGGR